MNCLGCRYRTALPGHWVCIWCLGSWQRYYDEVEEERELLEYLDLAE